MDIQSSNRTGSDWFNQLGMRGIGGIEGCIQPDLVAKVRSSFASILVTAIGQFDAKMAKESMVTLQ